MTARKPDGRPKPTTRLCPGCARRDTMLIDPLCVICDGRGTLTLGKAALSMYYPDVVSEAIELALEAAARRALSSNPTTGLDGLRECMRQLRKARVVAPPAGPFPVTVTSTASRPADWADQRRQASHLAGGILDSKPERDDRVRLVAPPDPEWALSGKPLDVSSIPGFSSAGFICALARAADPYDPMHTDRKQLTANRRTRHQQAETLWSAVEELTERTETRSLA